MRLELNNSGAWKLVLAGLQAGTTLDRAKEAAATLAAIDAESSGHKPQTWRLVSEADGKVIEHMDGIHGWKPGLRPGFGPGAPT